MNPLVAPLLSDIKTFAGARGYGLTLPIVPPMYEEVVSTAGMKNVTAEFVTWRAGHP